jgi:hypothetical protein
MLVLSLVPCVVGLATRSLHCQSRCWFIMLLVQLVRHIVGVVIGSSCCWSIALFPCIYMNPLVLVFCVVGCYSRCICFGEVLPPSPSP